MSLSTLADILESLEWFFGIVGIFLMLWRLVKQRSFFLSAFILLPRVTPLFKENWGGVVVLAGAVQKNALPIALSVVFVVWVVFGVKNLFIPQRPKRSWFK